MAKTASMQVMQNSTETVIILAVQVVLIRKDKPLDEVSPKLEIQSTPQAQEVEAEIQCSTKRKRGQMIRFICPFKVTRICWKELRK